MGRLEVMIGSSNFMNSGFVHLFGYVFESYKSVVNSCTTHTHTRTMNLLWTVSLLVLIHC